MWNVTHTIAYIFKWVILFHFNYLFLFCHQHSFYYLSSLLFGYICSLLLCLCLPEWSQPHSYYITRVLTLHATLASFTTCSGLFWQPRTCMFRYSSVERGIGSVTRRTNALCGASCSDRSSPSCSAREGLHSACSVTHRCSAWSLTSSSLVRTHSALYSFLYYNYIRVPVM